MVVVDLDHSRVRKLREGVKLLLEQASSLFDQLFVAGSDQPLERNLFSVHRVAHAVDDGRASASQHLLDTVASADDGGVLSHRLGPRTVRDRLWQSEPRLQAFPAALQAAAVS